MIGSYHVAGSFGKAVVGSGKDKLAFLKIVGSNLICPFGTNCTFFWRFVFFMLIGLEVFISSD